jgi:predicted small metal-binding protein
MNISADSKEELMKTALQHMSSVHGIKESLGLKDQLRARMKKGRPAA